MKIVSAKYLLEQEEKRRAEQEARAAAQQRNAQREQQAQRKATLARIKEGLRLSFVVYSDQRVAERYLVDHGFSSVEPLSSWMGTQGLCCLRGRQACLAFRGTDSLLDVVIDALAFPWYRPRVHFGFGRSWRSIRKKVRGWLENHEGTFDSVTLYGHSLGGAIAHIAALELSRDYDVAEVVTFGAPRSFWLSSAKTYEGHRSSPDNEETLGSVTLRGVNKLDLIARLPFSWLGYRHVGHLVYLSTDGQVYLNDEADSARSREGFLEPVFQFLMHENAAFYDTSSFPLTSHTASLSASTLVSTADIPSISARLQEPKETASDDTAAHALTAQSPFQPSSLFSTAFTPAVEAPSLRTLGTRLWGLYRKAKVYVPLVQVPLQGFFILIAPFILLAGIVLFFLRSGSSHLKLDYARYFSDATTQFDHDLARVKSELGISGSSKAWTIAVRVVKALVVITEVLGLLYGCFWLFTRWTWPLLLDWIQA